MTVIFDDELTIESVGEFIISLDNLVKNLEKDELIDFYLSTNGGHNYCMYMLLNSINKHADKLVIYLINEMYSCGFCMLWYMKDYNMYMLPSFREGMIHRTGFTTHSSDPHNDYRFLSIDKNAEMWIKRFSEIGVSEKDLEKYKNKEDIYFTREDILKFFPNIKEYEL